MFAPEIANAGVEAVVCDGDDTSRVSEERTPARDGVENRVEAQLGGLAG